MEIEEDNLHAIMEILSRNLKRKWKKSFYSGIYGIESKKDTVSSGDSRYDALS